VEPERWHRIEDLYHAAQAVDPDRRETFLRDSCGGDASLRSEVEELLAFDSRASGFIETPALHVLARQEARAMEASSGFRPPRANSWARTKS
jgi:serine/threonine-protein kinase